MTTGEKKFQIVVAEDNPADLALVREALTTHGVNCELHAFRDGESAMAFIDGLDADPNAPAIDLVIVDMHLPKHDGDDVLKRLRATQRYAETPVVVMSGLDSRIVEATATPHASQVYFCKPLSYDEFMEFGMIVRRLLEQTEALSARTTGGV